MNQLMENKWGWVDGSHAMRSGLMDALTDADLAFTPGGDAMTLGALCREIGEIEYAYLESFKALKQDFSYRNTAAGLASSVAKLKAWYQALDDEMKSVLSAFSDEDLKKTIDRGGFSPTIDVQLEIYLQALLIFFGKATIYFRAMRKPLPEQIEQWIG